MLAAGKINKAEHDDILVNALPSPGGCGVMATSNTMACLASASGIAVMSSASTPAMDTDHRSIHQQKLKEGEEAADALVGMIERDETIGDLVDERSFANASAALHAIGGSTNAVIHLPAIAEGFEVDFGQEGIRDTSNTPVLLNLLPTGKYIMVDLFEREGGIGPLYRYMMENKLLDGSARTIAGGNLSDVLGKCRLPEFRDPESSVIRSLDTPVKARSSLTIVKGDKSTASETSIVPQGCVFKISSSQKSFEGPARVFDFETEAVEAVLSGKIADGDVIVLRYQGVSVGCPELLRLTAALSGMGSDSKVAVVTDGRLSGVSRGTLVVHAEPEAWRGGPIALIEEGDRVRLDANEETLVVAVSPDEMKARSEKWTRPDIELPRGPIRIASQIIRPLEEGALWWPR